MHFLRELIQEQVIDLRYCPTVEQIADILTKPFTKSKYVIYCDNQSTIQSSKNSIHDQ